MRLLICAGGTGGGVYPALTVTERLKDEAAELLWVGSEGGMEAGLVERAGLPFKAIPAAGVHGVALRKLPGNALKLWKGYRSSKRILKDFQPDALLFTGGYMAIPMALAGRKVPSLLYVPDVEPGLALKTLARYANKIALTVDQSKAYFRDEEKLTVTGYPLRQELMKWTRAEALEYFHFSPALKTVLFMGGSSGARSINNAVLGIADKLVEKYQVIHLTGHLDWETVRKASGSLGLRYQAFPYLHAVGAALAAADLVVSRSGASVLGEYPYFGLPAILVPYPYAWRYQMVNAEYLVEREAAVLLQDERLKADLFNEVESLLGDKARLDHMGRAMRSLAQPLAAESIANMLFQMAEA